MLLLDCSLVSDSFSMVLLEDLSLVLLIHLWCLMILVGSLEPGHLCMDAEAPFTAISSSRLKDSVARRPYGSKDIG